jgi:membrane-bound lytic murein transglycosylase B
VPRPVLIPAATALALVVVLTAAAANGGPPPPSAPAAPVAAGLPYANWIVPTLAPELEASATQVQEQSPAKNAGKKKAKASRDERTYQARPAALAASGIPAPAMRAYKRAANAMASSDPTCGLRWELLAAIGRVESGHGTTGDSVMTWSGLSVPGIYGPVLDGAGPFALIRDTDDGRMDRNTVYDRAVGPMQFLPRTWSVVGRDGDGDGKVKVQDIDDAALGSAVYLCGGTQGLRTAEGLRANIFRYNRSDAYVELVIGVMRAYGAKVPTITPGQKAPSKPAPRTTSSPKPSPKPSTKTSPKPTPKPSPTATTPPTTPPSSTSAPTPTATESPQPSPPTSEAP